MLDRTRVKLLVLFWVFLDDESSSLVPVFLLLLLLSLLQKFQLFCRMSIAISLLLSVVYQRVIVKSCEVCF